jgi:hypothetical protein
MDANKADDGRGVRQFVHVTVKQGPGCCQIILWIVGIVALLAVCGVLTQMTG